MEVSVKREGGGSPTGVGRRIRQGCGPYRRETDRIERNVQFRVECREERLDDTVITYGGSQRIKSTCSRLH